MYLFEEIHTCVNRPIGIFFVAGIVCGFKVVRELWGEANSRLSDCYSIAVGTLKNVWKSLHCITKYQIKFVTLDYKP